MVCCCGILIVVLVIYRPWSQHGALGEREEMLSLMPEDASAVVYVDMAAIAFLAISRAVIPVGSQTGHWIETTRSSYKPPDSIMKEI